MGETALLVFVAYLPMVHLHSLAANQMTIMNNVLMSSNYDRTGKSKLLTCTFQLFANLDIRMH
jgi:hypothetical protein